MKYDPDTGEQLTEARWFQKHWVRVFKGKNGYFLQVEDMRWIYPLLPISSKAGRILEKEENEEKIESALSRLKHIDHKTISTVFLENFLEGATNTMEYKIVYPDGSTKG